MKSLALSLIVLQSSMALAGGISGGGGGTTNPSPVSQDRVAQAVDSGAGPILAYLKGAQNRYFSALPFKKGEFQEGYAEYDKALFAKLFSGPKSILDIFNEAKIEIRSAQPCYDADGKAWDGSIYANQPAAICISSLSMASKLNERNVAAETMALIIHELSHQLDATEAEAQAIQEDAIKVLSRVDLANYRFNMTGVLMWPEGAIKRVIKKAIANPKKFQGQDIQELNRVTVLFLQMESFEAASYFSSMTFPTRRAFNGYRILVATIQDAACIFDKGERPNERHKCVARQRKFFQNETSITAKKYLSRETGLPESTFGSEYDLVLEKITTYGGLRAALVRYLEFIDRVDREVQTHSRANYMIIRN